MTTILLAISVYVTSLDMVQNHQEDKENEENINIKNIRRISLFIHEKIS